ncbi:MAG: ASKHA domain-containing protein [Ilumatobacteraceae bacterium]
MWRATPCSISCSSAIPVMHHLVLGLDPTPLGQAPFTLATDEPVRMPGESTSTCNLPNAAAYVGPCIAGHVGADAAAAILAEGPHRGDGMQLLVDIGTNAEIVLGDRHRQFAASSPTGPAFEGAQISSGQRATTGAVERVRIDPDTLEPRVKVIGTDEWSDDPGFETAVRAAGGVTGICGSGIIGAIAEMVGAGIIDAKGTIRGEVACALVAHRRRRADVLLRPVRRGRGGLVPVDGHATGRACHPARQGRAAGRDRAARRACRSAGDPRRAACRRVRRPRRSRAGARHRTRPGRRPVDRPLRRQRGGPRRRAGTAVETGAPRWKVPSRRVVKIETATEPRFQELFVAALGFAGAPAPSDTTAPRRRRQRSVLCA